MNNNHNAPKSRTRPIQADGVMQTTFTHGEWAHDGLYRSSVEYLDYAPFSEAMVIQIRQDTNPDEIVMMLRQYADWLEAETKPVSKTGKFFTDPDFFGSCNQPSGCDSLPF